MGQTRFFAVDPGETTGWALFEEGNPVRVGQEKGEENIWKLIDELHLDLPLDFLVIENFRIRPGTNFAWNSIFPANVIGALKYWAHVHGVKVVLQEPAVKTANVTKLGVKKSSRYNHAADAVAHGAYFWKKFNGA